MDDPSTYALLTASAFFVVLAVALLYRYRQVSQRLSASTDLGHDLWSALDARLKKQDERILDMMGRVEVIQSRALEKRTEALTPGVLGLPAGNQGEKQGAEPRAEARSRQSQEVTQQSSQVTPLGTTDLLHSVESRLSRQESQIMEMMGRFEAIQSLLAAERARQPAAQTSASLPPRRATHASEVKERDMIQMLSEKPRTSVEIRQRFGVTREHAARLLKGLFDRGLVVRNDSAKPYVYELTDAGRQSLSAP
jgi:DNA-binding MarR family transcriptional regulator